VTATAADVVALLVAGVAGLLAGSVQPAVLLARVAGVPRPASGERGPDAASVWRRAGPGWGLLALSGELATGILPVAIGVVTWSWPVGAAAGIGALAGGGWPALGRLPGHAGRSPSGLATVLAGVAYALAPAAGTTTLLVAVVAAGVARLVGRGVAVAAFGAGMAAYPVLFLVAEPDPRRLVAVGLLYSVAFAVGIAARHH
jgi:Glycerol-3-phosphate acyltransferase